ncbi:hypothetical protein GCHA_3766 [Paraglaciecola chathamensis S18K6]|uniref:Uncharacterized protein n=1 Tax=Paraglaciecola chathamensis S18K6 TaxID=1127672 RepID=A0AAV3V4H1_9ALTE|nr:hypothetical protein GCHA_3766 [Paraglaciecola chathamensis S18K6]
MCVNSTTLMPDSGNRPEFGITEFVIVSIPRFIDNARCLFQEGVLHCKKDYFLSV